jgi:hypothetical protein
MAHPDSLGIVGPTHWQRTSRLIEAVRPNKKRHRVRAPLDAAHLHANATARAVEGNLDGFCVWPDMRTETAPARAACRGRCVGTPGWGAWGRPRWAHPPVTLRVSELERPQCNCPVLGPFFLAVATESPADLSTSAIGGLVVAEIKPRAGEIERRPRWRRKTGCKGYRLNARLRTPHLSARPGAFEDAPGTGAAAKAPIGRRARGPWC